MERLYVDIYTEEEVESDFSNVFNTWITKVNFVTDLKEREIIENVNFEEIEDQLKKKR